MSDSSSPVSHTTGIQCGNLKVEGQCNSNVSSSDPHGTVLAFHVRENMEVQEETRTIDYAGPPTSSSTSLGTKRTPASDDPVDAIPPKQAKTRSPQNSANVSRSDIGGCWPQNIPKGLVLGDFIGGNKHVKKDSTLTIAATKAPPDAKLGGMVRGDVNIDGNEKRSITYNGIPVGKNTAQEDDGYWEYIKKKLSPGTDCYKLENNSCALIINNIFNNKEKLANNPDYKKNYRGGAQNDTPKMWDLFDQYLKFDYVEQRVNVAKTKLNKILTEFREKAKRENYSSCFIIIMSHGKENSILMDDLDYVDLYKDIVYEFSDHDDFRDKPKVFIVQACRESDDQPLPELMEVDGHRKIQDILIAHSTIPHETADRCPVTGAIYIDEIDKVFRKSAHKNTLGEMLQKVFFQVKQRCGQNPQVQTMGFREYKFKM